jgi:hypothetical protein
MALTALNLAALPVIAGLMAGTGAMATLVVGPTSTPSAPIAATAPQAKPCDAQTWPYIDSRCGAASIQQNRQVRLVMAPRGGVSDAAAPEASGAAPAVERKMDVPLPAAPEQLVTRDTVGRSVETAAPAVLKRSEKRRVREERKLTRQAYQVPSETTGRRDQRPVIVVRPMRLDVSGRAPFPNFK